MDREAFTRGIKEYPKHPAAQEAFVAQAAADARMSARSAVSLMESDDPDTALNAELFLRAVDDLAIQPLLDAPVPGDPSRAAAYIEMLTAPELDLRRKVLMKLDTLLDDRRAIPLKPSLGPTEERPKPRRVCDEAYVAMRSLVNFGEDLVEQFADRDRFLSDSEEDRDAAIRRARRSATWQRALGREPEAGGPADDAGSRLDRPRRE
jgi:hypothetical protein